MSTSLSLGGVVSVVTSHRKAPPTPPSTPHTQAAVTLVSPVVGGCRAWEVSSRTCCDSGHWGPAGESCYLRFLQTSPWLQRWFDGGKAEIPLLPDFLRIIRSYQSLWSTEHPFWAPSLMAGVWGTVLGAIGEGGCWWGDRKSGTMTATLHCIISNRV